MAYLSSAVDDLRRRVRDAKYRNQLKKTYPFIQKFRGDRVYFKNITFGEYVVEGMALDTAAGEITQVGGQPRHPHATLERDGSIGFCGNQAVLRDLLFKGMLEEAILEAFRIITSYNPVGAVRRPPGSMICFACGNTVNTQEEHWDYIVTDRPDARLPGVYHSGGTQYAIYHGRCFAETLEEIKQIRRDKNGIP